MKVVYIAGPFRADAPWGVENNIRTAEFFGLEVAKLGAVPLIPHTMYRFFDGSLPDEFWLGGTMELLCKCDAVLLTPKWFLSTGAKAEKAEAERIGIPVFHNLVEVERWLQTK